MKKVKYFTLLCIFLFARPACAAIALDATANSAVQTSVSSFSFNHACSGINRVLVVSSIASGTATTTAVTYNGVSLTKADSNGYASIWYLIAPATGTNSVQVTLSSTATAAAASISLTGVSQISPVDAHTNANAGTPPTSMNLTTVNDKAWIIDAFYTTAGFSHPNAAAGGSQVAAMKLQSASGTLFGQSYLGPVTPAGSTALSWTYAPSGGIWNYTAASFAPAVAVLNTGKPMMAAPF